MATRGIRPVRDNLLSGWETHPEKAPSVMREDQPVFSRLLAGLGLFFTLVGALAMLAPLFREQIQREYIIGPGWGFIFLTLGLALILQHAFTDRDLQFRRLYAILGLLLTGLGALGAVIPSDSVIGARFVAFGIPGLLLGFLFLLAVIRNETDLPFRNLLMVVVGGLGGLMVIVGLLGGVFNQNFLFSFGIVLMTMGTLYLSGFIGMLESGDERGYYIGVAYGIAGAAAFVLALVRSALPLFSQNAVDYFVPSGLMMMFVGFVFMVFALALCSDWPVVVMSRRELSAYFHSAIGYMLLVAFLLLCAFTFWQFTSLLEGPFPEPIVRFLFYNLFPVILLMFVVPILTMRLLSEEKRTGTLEVMLTAPVNESAIVWSKFLGAFLFYLLSWSPLVFYLIALRGFSDEPYDYRPLVSFSLALLTTGAGFIAMGLFFSSLTNNQIIAAVFTFVIMVGHLATHFLVGMFSAGSIWVDVFQYVSFLDFWNDSLRGNLSPRFMVFHLSLTAFFLYLTYKVLEARKWK